MMWTGPAGASGNVLIDENADRVNSYNVWNYVEGHDSYYSAMLVDLTQPPDKVSKMLIFLRLQQIKNQKEAVITTNILR